MEAKAIFLRCGKCPNGQIPNALLKPRKKHLEFLLKLLITLLLGWAIYRQVFARENAHVLWEALKLNFSFPGLWWLIVAIIMVPVNVAFEALKWGKLIRNFAQLGFWRTFKAILAGTTIAIFTPNRIGEYGGRVLFVEPKDNWKAVIATIVGSLSQLLVLLSLGLIGAAYFLKNYEFEPYLLASALSMGAILTAVLFFCFFNIDLIIPIAKRIPFIHRFRKYLHHLLVLKNYHARELGVALAYSLLRYLTYSLQYLFLLYFYGIDPPWLEGLAGIATIFLVQASIPLPPLMGLLARGELALLIWGQFSDDQTGILASTFTLFVINIAVPALLGFVFIVQSNILKSLGYENGNNS